MAAPAVKIVNPDWPDDYIIIDAADFDPARDKPWPAGKVPWEKGQPQPPGFEAYAPEPPPAPAPEHKWQPVATLREKPASEPPKPAPPEGLSDRWVMLRAPGALLPEPEPDRRAAAETMAQTRILDLGPEIAKLRDVALLRELGAIETRSTVKRLIAVRLRELGA